MSSRFRLRLPLLAIPTAAASLAACDVEGDDVDALPPECTADGGECSGFGGAWGADGGGGGGGGGAGGEVTGGTPAPGAPTIDTIWESMAGDDSLTVAIDDAEETHTYKLGFAETGSENGWYGEDCIQGEVNGLDVCHTLGEDGGILDSVSDVGDVDNTHTLINKAIADSGNLTYVVIQVDTDRCWALGNDPTYYTESLLNCTAYDSP